MKKSIEQKDWVMLPTEHATYLLDKNGILEFNYNKPFYGINNLGWKFQHLYLTSSEKPENGDKVFVDGNFNKGIWIFRNDGTDEMPSAPMPYWANKNACKKIIATTDKSLTKRKETETQIAKRATQIAQIPENMVKYYVEKQGKVGDVEVEGHETLTCTEGDKCPAYTGSREKCNGKVIEIFKLKLTENNEIIVHLPKEKERGITITKMYSREDMHRAFCAGADFDISVIPKDSEYYRFIEWLEENPLKNI